MLTAIVVLILPREIGRASSYKIGCGFCYGLLLNRFRRLNTGVLKNLDNTPTYKLYGMINNLKTIYC